jgi:amino-acid N-acetyltransferase
MIFGHQTRTLGKRSASMANGIDFRPAQAEDWRAVAALLTQARLPLDGAQEYLADFILAWRDGELIGTTGLESYGNTALLRSVAVAETERGKGLGVALVQHVLDQAKQDGITSIVLLTETASEFFPRFGFRKIERDAAPAPVTASVEFQSACPLSATVMRLDL